MKKKLSNIEYKIEVAKWKDSSTGYAKECIELNKNWILFSRLQSQKNGPSWAFHEAVSKGQIKKLLSEKQYSKWRQGKSDIFLINKK